MKYQFDQGKQYFITHSLSETSDFTFNKETKEIIFKKLFEQANKYTIEINAFAILDNHVHVLLKFIKQENLKNYLKHFAGGSSFDINKYLKKKSPNWQSYYAWLVTTEKAYFNILAYILGNPIRHGLLSSFDELYNYKYCSFREYANKWGQEIAKNRILTVLKIKGQEDEDKFFRKLNNY